jgi:microsomal dipeptidase-like Zn-dependent dipeptidase
MHLLGGVEAPRDVLRGMTRVAARDHGKLRAAVLAIAARLFNARDWDSGWRVTAEQLEAGGVTVVCSALYRPFSEMDLDEPFGAPPESAYYDKLIELMDATERAVESAGHVMVRTAADLERTDGKIAFVHCVEGGFHLGAEPGEVAEHVRELAERGVAYITLAHLFWRQVTTNAPALPFLPDWLYNRLFPQPSEGLTELGVAAIEAMHEHGVLVDISHMTDRAVDETFRLIETLDRGRDPREYPVIASHAGYRFGSQEYMLTDGTISRIAARDGVVGLILAQHQINDGIRRTDTRTLAESLAVLDRHIDAIGPDHVAIGSDLDGFIKPTIGGVESAADLKAFSEALRARHPESADRILRENALRIIQRRFATR